MRDLVEEYTAARKIAQEAKARFDEIEARLCKGMIEAQIKSDRVPVFGVDHRVTLVAGETMIIDEEGLRKHVGAVAYRKLCKKPKASAELIEKALKDGRVDLGAIASYVAFKPNKPYLRVGIWKDAEE